MLPESIRPNNDKQTGQFSLFLLKGLLILQLRNRITLFELSLRDLALFLQTIR